MPEEDIQQQAQPEPQPAAQEPAAETPPEAYWSGDVRGQRVELSREEIDRVIQDYSNAVAAAQDRMNQPQQESAPPPQKEPEQPDHLKEVIQRIDDIGKAVTGLNQRFEEQDRQTKTQGVMKAYEDEMASHDFFRQMKESDPDTFRWALRSALIEQSGDPNMSRSTAIGKTLDRMTRLSESGNENFVRSKVQAAQRSTPPSGGAAPGPATQEGPLTGKDFTEGKTEEWAMAFLEKELGS